MTNLLTLTVRAVAQRTGLPRSTIYKLISSGQLAHLGGGKGRTIRILESSLEAWFDRHAKGSTDAPKEISVVRDADADLPAINEPVLS